MAGEVETVELPDVVAFLAAHVRRDERACRELLAAVPDEQRLLGYAVETMVKFAATLLPGGRQELLEWLTTWQQERREHLGSL